MKDNIVVGSTLNCGPTKTSGLEYTATDYCPRDPALITLSAAGTITRDSLMKTIGNRHNCRRWRTDHIPAKMKISGALAILGIASLCFGSTVAQADPVDLEPQLYHKASRDGWNLTIRIDNEKVNAVPNLAAASNSREAFVTFNSTATATGGSSPITDSIFVAGYQLGCQTDVSSGLQIGGAAGVSPQASIGVGGGAPGSVSLGASGGIAGFAQAVLQPGVIVDLPLANMALNDGGTAMLDVDNLHIKADACGGDVTIRSYVYQRISTAVAHTQFAVYGNPIKI